MSKINIEIDGKVVSLKVDGKKVENLKTIHLDTYSFDGDENADIYFKYGVLPEVKEGDEYQSFIEYYYQPSYASFDAGKAVIDVKHPTKRAYKGM